MVAVSVVPDSTEVRAYHVARKLRSDLRYAQLYAMQTQTRTRLIFYSAATPPYYLIQNDPDSNTGTYSGGYYSNDNNVGWTTLKNPLDKQNLQINLNTGNYLGVTLSGVALEGSTYPMFVTFRSTGEPQTYTGGAWAPFTSTTADTISLGAEYRVTITPETGMPTIAKI